MQFDTSTIIFSLIFSLQFVLLIWRPKCLLKILKLSNTIKDTPSTIENKNPNFSLDKIKEFEFQKLKVKNKLKKIRENCSHLTLKNGENKVHSLIDNINTYLEQVNPINSYIIEIVEYQTEHITSQKPKDDFDNIKFEIIAQLEGINSLLFNFTQMHGVYISEIKGIHQKAISEINKELNKYRKLKDILANASTIDVYMLEKKQHRNSYWIYLFSFFSTILIAFLFTYFSISFKDSIVGANDKNIIDYWILKASGVFISITLITFFIKQAIHHQKKRDQVEKIMLELKALPAYMADLKPDDAINLRKELATKYFGNSNDSSNLNEIGNIISEQLKNSTEVAKSSADIIKTLKNKI